MSEREHLEPEDGPIGKPSQAEGDDDVESVDQQGPNGKPSQAEGDDA